jgi:hypothetical protein
LLLLLLFALLLLLLRMLLLWTFIAIILQSNHGMLQVWAHVRASDSIREALEQEAARTLEALGTAQAAQKTTGAEEGRAAEAELARLSRAVERCEEEARAAARGLDEV